MAGKFQQAANSGGDENATETETRKETGREVSPEAERFGFGLMGWEKNRIG